MPAIESKFTPVEYWQIKAGKIAQKSEEGKEGAVKRSWTMKDGTKGEAWEIQKEAWKGRILSVKIRSTDFGQQCSIRFDDATISMPTAGKYFGSFAEVLPNIDLSEEVIIRPYDFEDKETGRTLTGISVKQKGEKVKNAYKEKVDGKWKTYKGYPVVDEKKKSKEGYWKLYYGEVTMFLADEIEKMLFSNEIAKDLGGKVVEEPIDTINVDEIPF